MIPPLGRKVRLMAEYFMVGFIYGNQKKNLGRRLIGSTDEWKKPSSLRGAGVPLLRGRCAPLPPLAGV